MSNVIAINAAAKKSIAAARATSDEMLLQSIAKGDRTAMHVLYSRHNVRVYRFVLRMVRDTTMAEDLVSQVFLDVWRTASQFEGRSQVSTWLLSIARFKALTALRQRKHEDIEQEDVLEIADEADTPEASLDRNNTKAILRACVAKLSPAHREIIDRSTRGPPGEWQAAGGNHEPIPGLGAVRGPVTTAHPGVSGRLDQRHRAGRLAGARL